MIEKINKILELQKELEEEHGIIGVNEGVHVGVRVQVYRVDDFMEISQGKEAEVYRNDLKFPFELEYRKDGKKFICVMDVHEYKEYKKISASRTANK